MILNDPIHLALQAAMGPAEARFPLPAAPDLSIDPQEFRDAPVCSSKNQYPTAQVAAYYATVRESLDPGSILRYYKCRSCHKWHLTSQPATTP